MSDTCPVVKIKTPSGWAHLDESDFDPARHELWIDPLDHDGDKKNGGPKPADVGDEVLTRDAVLALAGGNFMTFKAEAKKLLGDDMPSKKVDIIAEIEALPE